MSHWSCLLQRTPLWPDTLVLCCQGKIAAWLPQAMCLCQLAQLGHECPFCPSCCCCWLNRVTRCFFVAVRFFRELLSAAALALISRVPAGILAVIIIEAFGHAFLTGDIALAEAAATGAVGIKGVAANVAALEILDIFPAEVFVVAIFADRPCRTGFDAGIAFAGAVEEAPIMIVFVRAWVSR